MDSGDKEMGVTDGSWREKRKRGRPRKYGLGAPIIHSVSPLPIAESPPPGFSSKLLLFPVKNRTSLATGSGSVLADASHSKAPHRAVSENLGSGAEHKHKLAVHSPGPGYKINLEAQELAGREAQKQMRQFASTVSDLSTGFETVKKKIRELVKQVPGLVDQIQKCNDQKASWDEKKKVLVRERDKAREEAHKAVGDKHDLEKKLEKAAKEVADAKASAKKAIDERRDLELKLEKATKEVADAKASAKKAIDERRDLELMLEKATKQAEDVEASAKKAINEAALKFADEKRELEEKLEKAVKQVEDAQTSGKKAIYEAVASTTNCYKICLDNFVASLGNGEGKTLEDHVNKLVKVIPRDYKVPADVAVDMSGHEGDEVKKDDAAMQLRMSQRATKPNPKYG